MMRKSVIIILSLCLISPAFAHELDRLHPRFFEGNVSISPVPLVSQQATINLELMAIAGDCRNVTVQFRTPAGIVLSGQSVFANQYLTRGTSYRYFTDIVILKAGSYMLQATVYFQLSDGQQQAEHFFTYLVAGTGDSHAGNNIPLSITRQGLETRMLAAPSAIARQTDGGELSISGCISYYDDNLRKEVPIRRVMVELLEKDEQRSEQIASAYTDDNGFYSFQNVRNVDPEDGTGRDIQLKISFENDILRITDAKDALYSLESFTMYNIPDGEINNDYSLDYQNQHRSLGHIFNCVMDVYDFLQEKVNWRRKQITIKYPYGERPMYEYFYYMIKGTIYEEYIQVPAGYEWNKPMIIHEYGHAVMTALYGYNDHILPWSSFDETHNLCTVSDPGFAMKEGWAEFFEALIDDNAYNLRAYANAYMPNIESNEWWTGDPDGKGSNMKGEIVEGAVASVLWDIADTDHSHDGSPDMDDDELDDMFGELWDLMMKYKPFNILMLWDKWVENGYGQAGALYYVYMDHGIGVVPPGIKGDINDDGEIQSNDAILLLRIIAEMIDTTDYQRWVADMNEDNRIRANDAILILRKATGLAAPGVGIISNTDRKITISPTETHGSVSERMTVPLIVDNIDGLAGGEISVCYNPSVLRAVDVSSDLGVMLASNITEPGIVHIAFASLNVLNSQTLAEIDFDILSNEASPLEFKAMELYGSDAQALTSISVDKEFDSSPKAPERSTLMQNFPNPFNPDTWIPYQLKEGCEVTIQIYSTAGNMIRELELGYKSAGFYINRDKAAHWDGRNQYGETVASGVYFYCITAGDFSAVKKLTILK